MKIPKTIKIGCHNIKVVYPYKFKEVYDRHGSANYDLYTIFLGDTDSSGSKRPDSAILAALLHELLHHIEHISGHYVFKNMGELEEQAIDGFAHMIAQILIDNKFIELGK